MDGSTEAQKPVLPVATRGRPPFTVFLSTAVVLFFCTLSVADSVGFVPYYIDGTEPTPFLGGSREVALADLPELGEEQAPFLQVASADVSLPTHISIPSVGVDLPVQNPATRDSEALDTLLQKGPARYVDSARLGESGNLIIFAHSSHLPVVHNQMYRAFNKIPEVQGGETITLTGQNGKSYLYSVLSVRKADASDTTIDLSPAEGTKLTLVTCDTLTGKSARFILEAELIGSI